MKKKAKIQRRLGLNVLTKTFQAKAEEEALQKAAEALKKAEEASNIWTAVASDLI